MQRNGPLRTDLYSYSDGCKAGSDPAKPGMGVDEGYMVVYNEMKRILAFRKKVNKGR